MRPDGPVLVVNAGSSSIKTAVFEGGEERSRDAEAGIGTGHGPADHATAFRILLDRLAGAGIAAAGLAAAGHRVVHGGDRLVAPARVTPALRDAIADCIPLAPLHNPHNLAGIDALATLAPDLPQVACFDTAFHAGQSEVARRYALPDIPETQGIRRYGFHGLSYAAMVSRWLEVTGTALPERLLALHLGNGASACAILGGWSAATTMGYSPLEGLTMGTRTGSIDANAVLRLADTLGIDETRQLLNHRSGLLGLSGLSADMQELSRAATPEVGFAIDHFCHWAARQAAGLIPAMGGVDAIAFTGGIGENDPGLRGRIAGLLAWAGDPAIYVIPAAEEAQIAAETRACLDGNTIAPGP